jgi:peptide/nickel transport system substrate-binding protein
LAASERLSGTVTFLFTDIEGSTSLLKQLGRAKYGELLARQQELLREAFVAHGGEEIDTQGDSFFVAFRSAPDAVAAAVSIQRSLADHEWPDGAQVLVRIGIHTGEAAAAGERYVGFSVHRAARIGAAAHGGQVLLSSTTRDLAEDDLPDDIHLRDLGLWRLKDVDRPERVTQVAAEGLKTEFPPLRGAERVKERPATRRRSLLAAALIGVIAAAVAVPVFSLTGGGSSSAQATAAVAADSVGVFDARRGSPVAETQVGTGPSSVAVGSAGVWVTNTDDNTVSRISPTTHAVVQRIPDVGSGPEGVATGGGFVWVANSLEGTVSQIDPGTDTVVDRIRVGNQPTSVAFGLGKVWVTNSADSTVVSIDPRSGRPGRPMFVDAGAVALAVGDGAVWVASGKAPGSVTRLDPETGSQLAIPVGGGPTSVAVGSTGVWATNSDDGTVSLIDPGTDRQTHVVPVGAGPVSVAASSNGVWVSNELGGTLSKIDPRRSVVVQTVETDNRPAGLAVGGATVYVAVRTYGVAHRGGTLTLLSAQRVSYEPTLDPATVGEPQGAQTLIMTNDGLTGFKRAGGSEGTQLVADLASSLPTPTDGGRTYTLQVRRGIHYSTGSLVQPDDFRRAIQRSLSFPGGLGQYFYGGIVGASACSPKHCDLSRGIAVDPRANTITFHLSAPDPDFLYKLAQVTGYAVPASTPLKVPQQQPMPATGPYMFALYDPKHELRLVRNPYFHEWSAAAQPNGFPDEIIWKFSGDATDKDRATQVRAVERGQADVAYDSVPSSLISEVDTRFASQTHLYPALATSYIPLNTTLPPFNDVRVRRAFNYAIDRNRMARFVSPSGIPTCQVLPPDLLGYQRYCPYTIHPAPEGKYDGPDLAKARQLVAASGTKGQIVTIWFSPDRLQRTEYLESVLRSLGYKPRLKTVKDLSTLFTDLADPRKKIQLATSIGWQADYASPLDLFNLFTCGAAQAKTNILNYPHFCNRQIDAEITRASTLEQSDPKTSAELWRKVDRDVVNQAPWASLFTFQNLDFVSRRVGNYIYDPQWGALLDELWVK